MTDSNSKRTNKKLQVIDLTDDVFNFEVGGFTIKGFTASDGKNWFSAQIACSYFDLPNVSQAISRLSYEEKAIIILTDNGNRPVRHLYITFNGLNQLLATQRSRRESGFLYILQVGDYPEYKIGVAVNIKTRLCAYKTGLPSVLDVCVLYCIRASNYRQLEIELHNRYRSKRTRGEWFSLTKNDLKNIDRWINAINKESDL